MKESALIIRDQEGHPIIAAIKDDKHLILFKLTELSEDETLDTFKKLELIDSPHI